MEGCVVGWGGGGAGLSCVMLPDLYRNLHMHNHIVVAMLNWDEIIPVPIDVGIFLRFVVHFTFCITGRMAF
jgi:hypothetical protein